MLICLRSRERPGGDGRDGDERRKGLFDLLKVSINRLEEWLGRRYKTSKKIDDECSPRKRFLRVNRVSLYR
jgi:hypothetical protein